MEYPFPAFVAVASGAAPETAAKKVAAVVSFIIISRSMWMPKNERNNERMCL